MDSRRLSYACHREMQAGLVRFVDRRPLDDRLRDLGLPTLVVFGDRDRLHDPESSVARYRRVAGTEVARIPASGHSPMVETPAEFVRAVTVFLGGVRPLRM